MLQCANMYTPRSDMDKSHKLAAIRRVAPSIEALV